MVGLMLSPARATVRAASEGKEGISYSWTDIRDLGIRGRGWKEDPHVFNRLPAKAASLVREDVWELSHHTAGFYVKFKSNATSIQAN